MLSVIVAVISLLSVTVIVYLLIGGVLQLFR